MGLGYEGWVKIGDTYALGTGTAVSRAQVRLESASGYGGQIKTPKSEIGIGFPFNYDWETYDGTLNYEVTKALFRDELRPWMFDRQSAGDIEFSSRLSNDQAFSLAYWNNMSFSASEGGVVDGSLGFVGIERDSYGYGGTYINNKEGNSPDDPGNDTALCPDIGFPPQLNATANENPVPYWNTAIQISGSANNIEFISWSMDLSQEVVKFFGCFHQGGVDPGAQEPRYVAVGPMTVVFSGAFMAGFGSPAPSGFLGDTLTELKVLISDEWLKLKRLELNSESDDVQSPESLVPLTVEYAAYEISDT